MKITRKSDGKVFEVDIYQFARGEWGYALLDVDGEPAGGTYSDPDYRNERECRAAARRFVEAAYRHPLVGWCA
jgi:hypothetical protein